MNKKNLGSNSTFIGSVQNSHPNPSLQLPRRHQLQARKQNDSKQDSKTQKVNKLKTYKSTLKSNANQLQKEHPEQSVYYSQIMSFVQELQRKEEEIKNPFFVDPNFKKMINYQFRDQCISYFFDMGARHNYKRQTLYLALSIYDRYAIIYVAANETQIRQIAVASLFIAGKYIQYMPPQLKKIKTQFNQDDIMRREGDILSALDFDLTKWTAIDHLEYLFKLFGISREDCQIGRFIMDISIYSHQLFARLRPEILALSVLYVSAELMEVGFPWNEYPSVRKQISNIAKRVFKSFKQQYHLHFKVIHRFDPNSYSNATLRKM